MINEMLPLVTIIVPCRNEADYIRGMLDSVLCNDYPSDRMEILVVDGMSTDSTREIVLQEYTRRGPYIRMLDNPARIVPTAMNIGLKAAKGEFFMRIDGHAAVERDFIAKSVQSLKEHPEAWVVGGHIETVAAGYVGQAIAAAMQSPVGVGNSRFRLGDFEGYVDTLAFGTHRKWILDKIGFFDETLVRNQDDEFNLRIILAGGKIWMSPAIRSRYFARSSLVKLWRQYYQYGFWRIRTLQKHKRPASFRQLMPLFLVSSLLLWTSIGFVHTVFWWLLAGQALAYLLILLVGTLGVGRKSGWRFSLLSPIIFLILHFAYGIGCLWGIVRFIVLRGRCMKRVEDMKLSR